MYKQLEEENKKLKEKNEKLEEDNINLISFNEHYSPDVIVKYEDRYETAYNEECIENAKLCDKMRRLEEENKNLTKCNLNLQEWLDNKEKVNKSLREENKKLKKYYDRDKEELMESCYSLAKENEKLKSDLDECECSFWFESDEVWFWKREYKRLKKWIKDHCKWYWNLFPEDEMKRQWKKADKKRKLKWMLMEEDTLQELRDIGEI